MRPRKSDRDRVRRVGMVAIALLVATMIAALLLAHFCGLSMAQTLITVLASSGVPGLYLACALAGPNFFRQISAVREKEAERSLRNTIRAQQDLEASLCRIDDPSPLLVRWHPANDNLHDYWANIRQIPSEAGPMALSLTGRLDGIAQAYMEIPSGRLVVLGREGAGKTVLLRKFIQDVLGERIGSSPVPVIFGLESWDPTQKSLRDWLVEKLAHEYPAAGALTVHGLTLATSLVGSGRILPVLDGFDEIARGLYGAALQGLNSSGLRFLLSSRPKEYADAVQSTDVLTGAAVIELDDLTLSDLKGYLPLTIRPDTALNCPDTTGGPPVTAWDPVLSFLSEWPTNPAAQALRGVLTTPLMASLARAIYSDVPGKDPAELLDRRRFSTPEAIEDHLLSAYVPAKYPSAPHGQRLWGQKRPHWNAVQAQGWLAYLACHAETLNTKDLTWWQLADTAPKFATGVAVGVVNFLTFGVAGWFAGGSHYGAAYALAYGIAFGVAGFLSFVSGSRVSRSRVRFQPLGNTMKFFIRFAVGTAIGLVFSRIVGQPSTLLASVPIGVALGSYVWFNVPIPADTIPTPSATLRQDRAGTLGFGLAAGSALGIMGGLVVSAPASGPGAGYAAIAASMLICGATGASLAIIGYSPICAASYGLAGAVVGFLAKGPAIVTGFYPGLAYGITFGFGIALAVIAPRAWGSFNITRISLALRRRLPWRLMSFLEDAHHRGVLHQSGDTYEFRHGLLRDHLDHSYRVSQKNYATIRAEAIAAVLRLMVLDARRLLRVRRAGG